MDFYRTLDLQSNPMDSSHFDNNFKRTINCLATWANETIACGRFVKLQPKQFWMVGAEVKNL